MQQKELVIFKDGELELDVNVSPDEDMVWLTRKQLADLFDRDVKTIGKHLSNIFRKNELNKISTVAKFATVQNEKDRHTGKTREVERFLEFYNLDVIISVGCRVKSKRGIAFRPWANSVLKQYIVKGYSINQNKLNIPDYPKLVSMLNDYRNTNDALPIDNNNLLDFLIDYQEGLKILDNYDHHILKATQDHKDTYILTYDEW